MSIMDHDPKYAKLRAWREERRRKQQEAWQRTFLFPMYQHNQYSGLKVAVNWRPTISDVREREHDA